VQYLSSITVIAFVNPLSGSQRGPELLRLLGEEIGADHVFNIVEDGGAIKGLHRFRECPRLRVIACGGDGTIRWVMEGLTQANLLNMPALGIIPLGMSRPSLSPLAHGVLSGTGNDLSRQYGWGMAYTPKKEDIHTFIEDIKLADTRPLDIWQVKFIPHEKGAQEHTTVMFNYLNVGFDSQAAYGFHTQRKETPGALCVVCVPLLSLTFSLYCRAVQGSFFEQGLVW
jgi:diacylglycerol kinase (ATP)